MLPRLLKLLTTLLALACVGGFYVTVVRPRLQLRRKRQLAAERYDKLLGPAPEGTCYVCRNPGAACFDKANNRWFHDSCLTSVVQSLGDP